MKKFLPLILVIILFLATGCPCPNYNGYGRYILMVNCQTVTIDGVVYKLSKSPDQTDFVIAGHTFARGIYRKTRPWLYIHEIDMVHNKVDVTFDTGAKSIYPLTIGSSGSIFDVYSKPWELKKSTCILFKDKYWLVSHRWGNNGIYFDLQHNFGTDEQWELVQEIFVESGNEVTIDLIGTKVKIIDYNGSTQTATVKFSQI
jgi:hypothetical protein